ncbi:hypothetical protein KSP39_PZI006212 [Platanthera zijinensis]|uniref:BRO1 domain-containing protein n=1 Tax=Platanthera zijinensis TaxID=2320716 RepID=A0AAP0BU62_9ASPA
MGEIGATCRSRYNLEERESVCTRWWATDCHANGTWTVECARYFSRVSSEATRVQGLSLLPFLQPDRPIIRSNLAVGLKQACNAFQSTAGVFAILRETVAPKLVALRGGTVGLFYEEAYAALNAVPLNKHFDRAWISHVQLKAAQFYSEACYRFSLELHEKEEIAKEIARLKIGLSALNDARKSVKGVAL